MHRFLLEDQGIRGALVRLNETWRQVVALHRYPDHIEQLLGQGVAATVLLASGLKGRPRVSIQLQGEGPLRLLLVQCSSELRVRGMAQWRPHTESEPLLGEGRLVVNLDTGERNGLYQGIVPLVSNHLEACLEAYFRQSEQLATRLVLACDAERAAGLLLQALPGYDAAPESFAAAAELARDVSTRELMHDPVESLLLRAFTPYEIRLFKPHAVLHDCRCTPEHLANIARMLGAEELESILRDVGRVELTCEFCNRSFSYGSTEVEAILRGETPRTTLH